MKFANFFSAPRKLADEQAKTAALSKELDQYKKEHDEVVQAKLAAQEKALKLEQAMSELVGLVENLPKSCRSWAGIKKIVLCLEANGLRVVYPADAE